MKIEFFVAGLPKGAGSKSAFSLKMWLERICPECHHVWKVKDFCGRVAVTDDTGQAGKDWRQAVRAEAYRAMQESGYAPFTGPLTLESTFILPRPKAHLRTGAHAGELKPNAPYWSETQPDLTKYIRAIEDSMQGLVFKNDGQIAFQITGKRYADAGEKIGCKIAVWPVAPPL